MKGKPSKAAIAKALRHIAGTHTPLYTLQSLAKAYPKGHSELDAADLARVVSPLCEKAREAYAEAVDVLASGKHPAIPFLRKAADALDKLESFCEMAGASSDNERSNPRQVFLVTVRSGMLSFISESGRWMERAEEALGESPNVGWIDGPMEIEGLPEYVRALNPQQQWFIRELSALSEDHRATIANAVASLRRVAP